MLSGALSGAYLGELALLHALADVPVDERTLGVHEVELVVNARVKLGNGGGVRHHRDGAHDLGEVTARHDSRRLVVDAYQYQRGRGAEVSGCCTVVVVCEACVRVSVSGALTYRT